MTAGILGNPVDLSPGIYTTVYRVPNDVSYAVFELRIINDDGANAVTARAFLCPPTYVDNNAPSSHTAKVFPKDADIAAKGMSSDTGLLLASGWAVVVWVSGGLCNSYAMGSTK